VHVRALAMLFAAFCLAQDAAGQTRAAPPVDPATGPRPVPGPVYESAAFSRAVARGTVRRTS